MDPETLRVDHLKMIQVVIERMSRNSFALRAIAGTITAALVAAAANTESPWPLLGGLAIIWLMLLDAYFLHTEREFRDLYNDVRTAPAPMPGTATYFSLDRPSRRGGTARGLLAALCVKSGEKLYQ